MGVLVEQGILPQYKVADFFILAYFPTNMNMSVPVLNRTSLRWGHQNDTY